MRILCIGNLFPPHHLGGYELVWLSAVEDLLAAGHEVTVLASDFRLTDPDPRLPEPVPVRRQLQWYWRDFGFPALRPDERLRLEWQDSRVLERVLADVRPDVVSWWSMGGMPLSLIEQVSAAGVPSAATVCDQWLIYAPEVDAWSRMFARRPLLARATKAVTGVPTRPDPTRCIDSWLFLSHELLDRARTGGHHVSDARVVHRGPDKQIFIESPTRAWEWRLLYLGRIEERKGVDLAVAALAHLPTEATLAIDGPQDEQYVARLREIAARIGVEERVRFGRSPRLELGGIVAGADAVLFPVRWREPWGLVPLESMAVGRPVVATGRGGSSEYLEDGGNCVIFEPDEGPEALAGAVRRLAEDESLRDRLREGGFATTRDLDSERFNAAVEESLECAAASR